MPSSWIRSLLVVMLGALFAAALLGCEERDDGTTPTAESSLPPLNLTDETPDLLVTWIDDRGETHPGSSLAEVPDAGKEHVRIVTRAAGHGALFYVADLTKKGDDGSYAVRTVPASEWEKLVEDRRLAYRAKHAPAPTPKASAKPAPAAAGEISAIVYGASWCGPCHQATRHLQRQGVKVVEYDVEKEPARAKEMQQKMQRAGLSGSTIPVIDLEGTILQGFSARALDQALRKAQKTVTL